MAEKRHRTQNPKGSQSSRRKNGGTQIRSEINSSENMSRRQSARRKKKKRYDKRQRMLMIGVVIIVLVLAGVIGLLTRRNGSEILVNGTSVGVLETRKITKDDIVNSTTAMISEQVGTNVQIMDEIEVRGIHVSKKDEVYPTEKLLAKLRDSVAYNIEAYAIAVNGNVIATLKNESEAKEVLSYLNEKYTPADVKDAKISYVEDVQIVSQFANADDVMNIDDAKDKIVLGESSTKSHAVQPGETLSSIASKYGMTLNELMDLNPQLSVNTKIFVGQEMTVKYTEPFITVKATATITKKESSEKEIEYQYDNTKSKSYKKIIQPGTGKVAEETKEVVYINGVFESENVISSKTITEPVKEIVCIGTN